MLKDFQKQLSNCETKLNKMNKRRIPIIEAKNIAKKYGQAQVIIVTWDKENGRTHVVTYGESLQDCDQAAKGGNVVKKALGFPDALCHEQPARVLKKKATPCVGCGKSMLDHEVHLCKACASNFE